MKIGIFWVYKSKVLGQSCDITQGSESVAGLVDTNFSHYEAWELSGDFLKSIPELIGTEYQTIPRGRVIYSKRDNKFLVYLDQQLMNDAAKASIREYFGLTGQKIRWIADSHYLTFDNG